MKRLGTPPYICLITKGELTPENYEIQRSAIVDGLSAAAADGVNVIQIREKAIGGRQLLELTRAVVDALALTGVLVLVNDRADVASAARADGVHLPASSLSASVVREHFPELVIGVSTHSLTDVRAAAATGADYALFGPVFTTPGKGAPVGLRTLADVCRDTGDFPVVAVGGIDDTNFELTLESGAAGIAAIRSMYRSESRRVICERLKGRPRPVG